MFKITLWDRYYLLLFLNDGTKKQRVSKAFLGSHRASSMAQQVKNLPAMQETQESWAWSIGWEIPWRRKWQPTPAFLCGESHGQRSLVDYSPWDHRESDMTEVTAHRITHTTCKYTVPDFELPSSKNRAYTSWHCASFLIQKIFSILLA